MPFLDLSCICVGVPALVCYIFYVQVCVAVVTCLYRCYIMVCFVSLSSQSVMMSAINLTVATFLWYFSCIYSCLRVKLGSPFYLSMSTYVKEAILTFFFCRVVNVSSSVKPTLPHSSCVFFMLLLYYSNFFFVFLFFFFT